MFFWHGVLASSRLSLDHAFLFHELTYFGKEKLCVRSFVQLLILHLQKEKKKKKKNEKIYSDLGHDHEWILDFFDR